MANKKDTPEAAKAEPEQKTENKRERFVRLANARTIKAVKVIRSLGKLFSKNYQWSMSDFEKIEAVVRGEMIVIEDSIIQTEEKDIIFDLNAPVEVGEKEERKLLEAMSE